MQLFPSKHEAKITAAILAFCVGLIVGLLVVVELTASWAAAAVALLAVLVGPLVSRWQINQTARTNEAISRIQVMTDDLAAFVALSSSLATNPNLHKTDVNEWKKQIDKLSFYKARIALRLNPR